MAKPDKDAIMKAWMQAAALGEHHAGLGKLLGNWEISTKSWMDGPLAPPMTSKGTTTASWLLEGRWLIEKVTADMMGQPFSGVSLIGYDNLKKKYVGIWLDSMSTTMMRLEGNFVDSTTLVQFGFYDDPVSGEHDRVQRFVIRIVDDNLHVLEISDLSASAQGAKMMEIEYRRIKS